MFYCRDATLSCGDTEVHFLRVFEPHLSMDCEFQTSGVSWSREFSPRVYYRLWVYLLVPLKVLHRRDILLDFFYQPRTIYPPRSGSLVRPARETMSRLVSSERAYQSTSKTAFKSLWDSKLARNGLWQNITQVKEYSFSGYTKVIRSLSSCLHR